MKRFLRWIGIVLAGLAGLVLVAYAVIYLISERKLHRVYPIRSVAITAPDDEASVAEGKRLATIRGCVGGCHGKQVEGSVMFDDPMLARLVAPNLTAAVRKYSDAELAVVIRDGLRPDGRSVMAMPAEAYHGLTDADVGRIIAFLKSLPATEGPAAEFTPGPIGRFGLATGEFRVAAQLIADAVPLPAAKGEDAERGRYLARTICVECHGIDLRGDSNPDFTSPDLRVVAGYPPEAFTALLRTGVALGDRELGTMSPWARTHLSHLTDDEIADLYAYLHSYPEAVKP